MKSLKDCFEQIPFFKKSAEQRRQKRQELEYGNWLATGKPVPPPHIVKQKAVKKYAFEFGCDTFVESGTYLGDMVFAVLGDFKKIYSIELSEEFFRNAQKRFAQYNHVHIWQGDSGQVMREVVQQISDRALFWLDGHYSSGQTAQGKKDTPIFEELQVVFKNLGAENVLLIDDAREFVGENDYPTLLELENFVEQQVPGVNFSVKDDVIRIVPSLK